MSFFQEESDDSNLQYDNAAFLYFIASALIVGAAACLGSIIADLLSLVVPHRKAMSATGFLQRQIDNLAQWKRGKAITKGFFAKIAALVLLSLLTVHVYQLSRQVENKMKGFDPFEILGLAPGSTLREVKKAYRKLALEFHPDRNQGDPAAQAKFILISKSYECFTDESKTANCFKYGNPDGAGSFRVGIGLPKLFIEAEYKWYVLPLVLSIFLVVVPCLILRWSNRTRSIDPNGIDVRGYRTLFMCMEVPTNKYTAVAFLASYFEFYAHPLMRPIAPADRLRLEQELTRNPDARRPVLQHFSDRQLQAYWEIYRYCSGLGEFSHPDLQEEFERLLETSFHAVKPFATRLNDGVVLLGNPDWTIRYVGMDILYGICRFSRDYYNRALTCPDRNLWLNHLSLSPDERDRVLQLPLDPLVAILQSPQKLEQLLALFDAGRREALRRELAALPVYRCEAKIEADGVAVESVTPYDYVDVKYRVGRQAGCGFCALSRHPFPKAETLYLVMSDNENGLCLFQKIEFREDKLEHIGKVPFRAGKAGVITLTLHFISTTYYAMDVGATISLRVDPVSPELENKKIEYHPEDINIEKGQKGFFEQLMDLQIDTDVDEMSDSDDEDEKSNR